MNEWWKKHVIRTVTNPVLALYPALFFVIYTGIAWIGASLIAERKREVVADLRLFANELSLVLFITTLVAGAIAITYKLMGRVRQPAPDDEPFLHRAWRVVTDPFYVFEAGLYAVIVTGLIHIALLMIELQGFGELLVWSQWVTQLFYLVTATLVLVAVRAVLHSISDAPAATSRSARSAPRSARPAPGGAAEGAATEARPASSPESESAGSESAGKADGPRDKNRVEGWLSHVWTWQQQLHYGAFAVAYLGLLILALDMWAGRNDLPRDIWRTFFYDLALIAGAVGIAMLLSRVAEIASGEPQSHDPDGARNMADRVFRMMSDPAHAVLPVLMAVGATASAWGLINIWSARSADVEDFWAQVTFTSFRVIAAITLPLLLWSLWKVVYDPSGARPGPAIVYQPVRLLNVLIYLLLYLGLIYFCLDMLNIREGNTSAIWWRATLDLFTVAAVIGIVVAIRAVLVAAFARTHQAGAEGTVIDVVPDPEGGWNVVRPGGQRASAHTDTQQEAIERAREILGNDRGGELRVHGRDGQLRESQDVERGSG